MKSIRDYILFEALENQEKYSASSTAFLSREKFNQFLQETPKDQIVIFGEDEEPDHCHWWPNRYMCIVVNVIKDDDNPLLEDGVWMKME